MGHPRRYRNSDRHTTGLVLTQAQATRRTLRTHCSCTCVRARLHVLPLQHGAVLVRLAPLVLNFLLRRTAQGLLLGVRLRLHLHQLLIALPSLLIFVFHSLIRRLELVVLDLLAAGETRNAQRNQNFNVQEQTDSSVGCTPTPCVRKPHAAWQRLERMT
jgi:hypothetical protein